MSITEQPPSTPTGTSKGVSRRSFIGALIAAPTLTAVLLDSDAQAGLFDSITDPVGDVVGSVLPDVGLEDLSDIVDLGDLIIAADAPFKYNMRIEVTEAGRVYFELPRLEKGQGISTAAAAILADEIGARLDDVDVELADARLDRPFTVTGSSSNVRALWEPIRTVAAGLRARLITAAANVWGADPFSLEARDTMVVHPDGRTLSFGALTAAASQITQISTNAQLRDPSEYRVIGQPQGRIDARDIVTGQADYALDLDIPNADPAVIARAPDIGGTVVSFDDSVARSMPGVKAIVEVSSGVAVVARTYHEAFQARDALVIEWDRGPLAGVSDRDIADTLRAADVEPLPSGGLFTKVVEDTFEFPYVAHAPMEVMSAVADVRANDAEVWYGSQTPVIALQTVASAIGMSQEQVTLHVPRSGGAFGRRLFYEPVVEAAEISQAAGQPVKLMWTRNDDTRHGRFRPMSINRVRARMSGDNVLTFDHRMTAAELDLGHGFGEILTAGAGQTFPAGFSQTAFHTTVSVPYDFGAATQLLTEVPIPVPTGSWRSIYSGTVITANEIIVDRMARRLRRDPVEFRRSKLSEERAIAVLDRAAEMAGWGRQMPHGVALGAAIHVEYRSVCAYVVELDTNPEIPRVTNVWVAVDVGRAINPKGLEAQMQGVVSDAITTVLRVGNRLDDGRIREGSYGDFLWARMDHSPFDVEVDVMAPTTGEPGGAGELGYPTCAAAIVNAYTRATGEQPNTFPIFRPSIPDYSEVTS